MEKRENKQEICNALVKVLKLTRDASDVADLIYNADNETVLVLFNLGGVRLINVAMDSGVAMIRDIMRGLGV